MKRLAVAGLLLLATACSTSGSPHVLPPREAASAQTFLEQAAGTKNVSNIVRTLRGYEAASWDNVPKSRHWMSQQRSGPIWFWRATTEDGVWRRVGSSTYPAGAAAGYGCKPTVQAGYVGGPDAVFVVYPCLTGDGNLNAVAFTKGPKGWGLVEALHNGNIGSLGHSSIYARDFLRYSSAARYRLAFKDGELETIDGTWFLSDAENNEFPRVTLWRWSGDELAATSTNAFEATPRPAPDFAAPALPPGDCPVDGTYSASFGVSYQPFGRHRRAANAPLRFVAFPVSSHYPVRPRCTDVLPSRLPMTVELARSRRPYALHPVVSGRRWMSAPLWLVVVGHDGFLGHITAIPVGRTEQRTSPYVVPLRYRLNVVVARFGDVFPALVNYRSRTRPTDGTVTFRDGRVVGLAVRP